MIEGHQIHIGDCLKVLKTLDDNSIDSMVTDPPAGISFMGKSWDSDKGGPGEWREWLASVMKEALRVMKPGAHGLVWSLPRTSHWTGMALEMAGFEIRDTIHHTFGSGFVQGNRDMGKYVDESLKGWGTTTKKSHEVWWLIRKPIERGMSTSQNVMKWGAGAINVDGCRVVYEEGDSLKGKVFDVNKDGVYGGNSLGESATKGFEEGTPAHDKGRWPPNTLFTHDARCSNVCVDDCPVRELDKQSGISKQTGSKEIKRKNKIGFQVSKVHAGTHLKDEGGASRYFPTFRYQAKPSATEKDAGLDSLPLKSAQKLNAGGIQGRRDAKASAAIESQGIDARGRTLIRPDGTKTLVNNFIPGFRSNNHPTVKPIALMAWLCKLITPKNGIILDPFTGSGSTGCGAMVEGFRFCGIEMNAEFAEIAGLRIEYWKHHDLDEPRVKAPADIPGQGIMFQ